MKKKYVVVIFSLLLITAATVFPVPMSNYLFDEYSYYRLYMFGKAPERCNNVKIISVLDCRLYPMLEEFRKSEYSKVAVIVNDHSDSLREKNIFRTDTLLNLYGGPMGMSFLQFPEGSRMAEILKYINDQHMLGNDPDDLLSRYYPVYFYGDYESFHIVDCADVDQFRPDDQEKIILAGYLGANGSARFSQDSIEVVPTIIGPLYETILLANIICSYVNNKVVAHQGEVSTILIALSIVFINSFFIGRFEHTRFLYLKLKAIQVLQVLSLLLATHLFLTGNLLLISTRVYLLTIIFITELIYWLMKRPAKN